MKHITQSDIAKQTGLSQGYISSIMSGGKKLINYSTAKKLADATGTDPLIWLEGTPADIQLAVLEAYIEKRRKKSDGKQRDSEGSSVVT